MMKQLTRSVRYLLCVMAVVFSLTLPSAAAEQNYYDCLLRVYGVDASGEKIVTASIGIQVQAGDGSGDTWAVTSQRVTEGAAYYLVTDAKDTNNQSWSELIAADEDSGIAVLRLENRIETRTAPAMATLDGVSVGEQLVVAGLGEMEGSNYFFSHGAAIQNTTTHNGYTALTLTDTSDTPLSQYAVYPIGALMTSPNEVIGFYIGSYLALPAGYIMPSAGGIGTLDTGTGDADQNPPSSGEAPGDAENPSGNVAFGTVETPSGIEELIGQGKAERRQSMIFRAALIVAALAVAGVIIAFALRKRRRNDGDANAAPVSEQPVQPVGKTEYAGGQVYGKTEPAVPCLRVVPLPGTPGAPREVPLQGLTFGRSPDCDVTFSPDTGGVSGKHCSLIWRGGVLYLKDLGSSYGTLLENGRKLTGEEAAVEAGTRFYLGSHKIGFQIIEAR